MTTALLGEPAEAQVQRAVGLLREVLGDDLLGAWLYGSAVVGGLQPRSDLDVLALGARPTTDAERATILGRLLRLSGRGAPMPGARSLEVTLVARGDIEPWRYPPRMDLQYGDWWRPEFEAGSLAPWANPNPDLATLLAMVRLEGRPLVGPVPAALLPEVPLQDVRRAMLDSLPDLLADLVPDTRNVVLTLARMWATLETGRFLAKDAAAAWAGRRLADPGDRALLATARDGYLGTAEDVWPADDPDIARLAARLVDGVRAAAAT